MPQIETNSLTHAMHAPREIETNSSPDATHLPEELKGRLQGRHVLIVGGGVGGTIVANLLARSLQRQEAEITLIDSTGKHAYMPGWLYLPFNQQSLESDQLIRPERDLLNHHVHLVTGDVQRIDHENRELHVRRRVGLDEIVGTGGASEAV